VPDPGPVARDSPAPQTATDIDDAHVRKALLDAAQNAGGFSPAGGIEHATAGVRMQAQDADLQLRGERAQLIHLR